MKSELVLELPHKRNIPRNSEGAFVTLANGRILFAYTRYYGSSWSDIGTATISSRCSSDGGATWTRRDRLLVANEGAMNVMSPSLLRLKSGGIALFYLRTNSFLDCRMYLRVSRDEAVTWGEPVLCMPAPGYFVVNNDRVIQLSSGRIVIPAAFHRSKLEADPTNWNTWDSRAIALFFLSDDDGRTWRESADWVSLPVASRSGMQEPGVIELGGGKLYAWARTDTGFQWEMTSGDFGETWSQPGRSAFMSPNSSMSIKAISEQGSLLAVWNDRRRRWRLPPAVIARGFQAESSWGRTPLVAATSPDGGGHWRGAWLVESDPRKGFCYAAIHPVGSDVLLAYCCGGVGGGVLQDLRIRRVIRLVPRSPTRRDSKVP